MTQMILAALHSSICDKTTPSTPKKAILASKNLVTPFPASEKWSKVSNSKVASSHPSCSTVVSVITAFNSSFNVDYHASLRPKRRSHHAPTYAKTYPTIKNSSPSCSSSSPSFLQACSTSQRKNVSPKTYNLPPEP